MIPTLLAIHTGINLKILSFVIRFRNYMDLKIPQVIGIIDGTMLAIKAPTEFEDNYFYCRKGLARNQRYGCKY